MEKIILQKRDVIGKKSKRLSFDHLTPSVLYNAKGDSYSTMIETAVAGRILREATSTTILDAQLDSKDIKVVVKELDINPLTEIVRHVAFFEIDENKEMVFSVPFKIIGISPAVKNNLGVMVEVLNAVDVKCKVADLVPYIEVDISKLDHPGQSISISDLTLPEKINLVNDDVKNATVVTITDVQKEEVITAPTEVVVEEGTDAAPAAEVAKE